MSEEKVRLGGMALANGVLVHGPTSWACAIRTDDGELKVVARRKRFSGAKIESPLLRGPARLADALAIVPQIRRALPEARLPFQRPAVLAAMLGSAAVVKIVRTSPKLGPAAQELASGLLSVAPAALALRGSGRSWRRSRRRPRSSAGWCAIPRSRLRVPSRSRVTSCSTESRRPSRRRSRSRSPKRRWPRASSSNARRHERRGTDTRTALAGRVRPPGREDARRVLHRRVLQPRARNASAGRPPAPCRDAGVPEEALIPRRDRQGHRD